MSAPIPSVIAILLCDQVITDQQSSKKTLVGLFDSVHTIQFPTSQDVWVYVRMTDANGKYKFRLEVQLLETETPIGVATGDEVTISDQLSYVDIALRIPRMPIPAPGKYEFLMFANNIFIGRTTMTADKIQVK